MERDVRLRLIAARQRGLISLADTKTAGFSSSAWGRRRDEWNSVFPGVYRHVSCPASFEQRCFAALLSIGGKARLSHRTAAALLGFDGFTNETTIHLVTPEYGRRKPTKELVVHVSDVPKQDQAAALGMWVTAPARTLVDLASCVSKRELEDALDSAVRRKSTSPDAVKRRLEELRGSGRAGCRLLSAVLGELPKGELHTRLEREFVKLSRIAGLDDPVGQVVLRDGSVFIGRLDFFFPKLNLIVEVSGIVGHSSRNERAGHAKRRRKITSTGVRYMEFTSDEVFHQPEIVVAELRALR